MLRNNCAIAAAIGIGVLANALPGRAQQEAPPPQTNMIEPAARLAPPTTSKTELASRFQQIKNQYAMLKTAAAKHVAANSSDSQELKQARSQLASAMRTYEYYERIAQVQRNNLDVLTALTEADSIRMQFALDRMARLQTIISNLMKKLSETGGAVVQNTN